MAAGSEHFYAPVSSAHSKVRPREELVPESSTLANVSDRGVALRIFLMEGSILILLAGFIMAVVSYTCVAFQCSISRHFIISSAPLGKVLTLSQVASHIAPVMLPVAMKVCSYELATGWMRSSERAQTKDLPSPLQYGLLLLVCTNANIVALVTGLVYVFNMRRQRTLPSPPVLRKSITLLAILVVSSYTITASDAWLHASSSAVSIRSTSPLIDSRTGRTAMGLGWGRSINTTRCDNIQSQSEGSSFYKASCGQLSGGSGGNGFMRMEGLRTLSNSSSFNQVVYTDDQIAIMVPADLPRNTTYTASTIGARAKCRSITNECIDASDYGPEVELYIRCRGPTVFNGTAGFSQGALDANGNGIPGFEVPSNPFHVGAVITSQAYYDEQNPGEGYHQFRTNTGWFRHGSDGFWNVIHCNVTTFDVVYTFSSLISAFKSVSYEPTTLEHTRYISTFEFESVPSSLGSAFPSSETVAVRNIVDGAGLRTNQTYEEVYALELSRQTIARGATLYIGVEPFEASSEGIIIGSRLDIIPLCLMLGMMAFYAMFVFFTLLKTLISSWRTPFLRLASIQLTNPLVVIHGLYGPKAPAHTWEPDVQKKFGTEADEDRLMIGRWRGVGVYDGESGTEPWFGIKKITPIRV